MSFKRMNRTTNNYFRALLMALTSLSMLFSTLHSQVQLVNAQNNGNSTRVLPTLTPEQIQQLAANNTSFDVFLKHRIAAMNAAKIPVNYRAFNSLDALKSINLCTSALAKVFGQSLCDSAMATLYEICQAIPDHVSYCVMPSINSYIKDRNMVDGQTDKLAWQVVLHGKEIAANPYGISDNSTAITNTTAMEQTGGR
jgi:hypothetical protein